MHAHIIPNQKFTSKNQKTCGHISPAWAKSREINSYITDLRQKLISREGHYWAWDPRGTRGTHVLSALHTIPRADTQGVSKWQAVSRA